MDRRYRNHAEQDSYLRRKCIDIVRGKEYHHLCRLGTLKKDLIVFKKTTVLNKKGFYCDGLSTLLVPGGALIHWTINDFKCRAEYAIVLKNLFLFESIVVERAQSAWDSHFPYEYGALVVPRNRFKKWGVCASGIHFFLTKEQALNY